MLVHLLTGVDMPKRDPESHLLVAALEDLGAAAQLVPWRGPGSGSQAADIAVVRSTWDYTPRREEFVGWCRHADQSTPVHNGPDVIEWNSHKQYLLELRDAGVPAMPTVVVGAGDSVSAVPGDWDRVVIKPAVSSGAVGAGRFDASDPAAVAHLRALLQSGDALVQPFAESVPTAGERSLIFLGGTFSHAVNKTPVEGDYRVQESRGGRVALHDPAGDELEAAYAAVAIPDAELLYARVDLVDLDGAPHVIELELIEPELFLGVHPEAPGRLARAILERVPK